MWTRSIWIQYALPEFLLHPVPNSNLCEHAFSCMDAWFLEVAQHQLVENTQQGSVLPARYCLYTFVGLGCWRHL